MSSFTDAADCLGVQLVRRTRSPWSRRFRLAQARGAPSSRVRPHPHRHSSSRASVTRQRADSVFVLDRIKPRLLRSSPTSSCPRMGSPCQRSSCSPRASRPATSEAHSVEEGLPVVGESREPDLAPASAPCSRRGSALFGGHATDWPASWSRVVPVGSFEEQQIERCYREEQRRGKSCDAPGRSPLVERDSTASADRRPSRRMIAVRSRDSGPTWSSDHVLVYVYQDNVDRPARRTLSPCRSARKRVEVCIGLGELPRDRPQGAVEPSDPHPAQRPHAVLDVAAAHALARRVERPSGSCSRNPHDSVGAVGQGSSATCTFTIGSSSTR